MRTSYDPQADILMIELVEDLATRRSGGQMLPVGGAFVDLDAQGTILGIEIMDAGKKYSPEVLARHPEPAGRLSLAEAARIAGVSGQALRKACERGRLTGEKIGRDWLVTLEALHDYLDSRRHAGPGSAPAAS